MSHEFYADAANKAAYRERVWYQNNLMNVLQAAKERHVRDIDASITLGKELLKKLEEKVDKPVEIPLRHVTPSDDDSLMKPIEPEVLNLLYSGIEKGSVKKYLKKRNEKAPEEKFFFRVVTSWDYGWQQKYAKQRARDVNRGHCAILRDTFYRKNNLAPDPKHYNSPSGGEFSTCSEYSCNFN